MSGKGRPMDMDVFHGYGHDLQENGRLHTKDLEDVSVVDK